MKSKFCELYETKIGLTKRVATIFYNQNKRLLSNMALDCDDLIQLFLIKFMKYEKESFINNCANNKYWVTLCLKEFRLLMLQEYRKPENNIKKVEIEKASEIQIINKEDNDFSEYEYLHTEGLEDFKVESEQYYIHVDPCVKVYATTTFPVADGPHASNGEVKVPVVYTKMWGKGRVFYNSLGHTYKVFDIPEARELMTRGLLWAAK